MAKYMNKKVFANFIMRKIIRDINFYASPNFDKTNVIGIAKARSVFTVVDFVKKDGTEKSVLFFIIYDLNIF